MRISLLICIAATLWGSQSAPTEKGIPAIVKTANGAVVSIVMMDKDGNPIAQGSGFLVSKDGLIVTNYHVIANGISALAKLPDGAFFVVDGVMAFDKVRDIAVIKAHGENFRTLVLGDSDRVQVGQAVVAIGNPLSLESTVSNGIVSSIRTIDEKREKYLQITAPISPGSSGGPLLNMSGEVVGITTMYLKEGQNLNFAIPVDDVKHLLQTKISKLQDLPNEPESIEAQASPEEAPSSPLASGRDFYKQLYEAGGAPDKSFVCFSDNSHNAQFFAFRAIAYDKTYAKAYDEDFLDVKATPERRMEALNVMESIHRSDPYLSFLDDQVLNSGIFASSLQAYFRQGGRVMEADFYSKGVKTNSAEYHWDGSSWILQYGPEDPNADLKTTRTFRLSIEPATLRYTEFLTINMSVGSGDTKVDSSKTAEANSGVCEEILPKQ